MPDTKEARALVKLLPEQIAGSWRKFRPIVRETVPPQIAVSNQALKQILQSLLARRGHLWVYRSGNKLVGMVVTTIQKDPLSGARSLLIYGMYAWDDLTAGMINDAMNTLGRHAEDRGLDEVIAFSANEKLTQFFKDHRNADVSYRLIRFQQ